MTQAAIKMRRPKALFLAAALVLTSGASLAADLSTEFIHAPKFSEAEKSAVRSHFGATTAAEQTTSQEAQTALQAGAERRALPRELMIALPRRDGRFMRLLVKDDVILLDRLTGMILDVIPDVTCRREEASCTHPDA